MEMKPILALWAVPRSTSTAFERMMRQRGDHDCVHEPFGEVWYSIGNATHPPPSHVQHRPSLSYESAWKRPGVSGSAGAGVRQGLPALCHRHARLGRERCRSRWR